MGATGLVVRVSEPDAGRRRMTREEIAAMIAALGDMCAVIREADPADKAEIYKGLKLRLTYHPEDNNVRAEIPLDPHIVGLRSVPSQVSEVPAPGARPVVSPSQGRGLDRAQCVGG
jgi:hypothetical protein